MAGKRKDGEEPKATRKRRKPAADGVASKPADKPSATAKPRRRPGPRRKASATPAVDERMLHALIAQAAYYRAEKRGFAPGDPVGDWLEAEIEVRQRLERAATR